MNMTIRQARPADAKAIYDMIYELAVYEKAPEQVVTTVDEIRASLFASDSKTEALICEIDNKVAGYAVFFTSYSTARSKRHLYGRSVRHSRISWSRRWKSAIANHRSAGGKECGRTEWSVLDWNQPAIDFI